MRKLLGSMVVGLAMIGAACSGQGSVAGPSAVASNAAGSSNLHVALTAAPVTAECKPPVNSIVFDANQLGHVTITNNSPCTNEFLYIVWLVAPDNSEHQARVAAEGARLAPGERRELTVGFDEVCGSKYQRDVYIGVSDDKPGYTYSDMHNYFFAALGYYQYARSCDAPSAPRPLVDAAGASWTMGEPGPIAGSYAILRNGVQVDAAFGRTMKLCGGTIYITGDELTTEWYVYDPLASPHFVFLGPTDPCGI